MTKQKRQKLPEAAQAAAEGASAPADTAAIAVTRPVEGWRKTKSTPSWAFAAAKMMHAWPIGRVLSESDYDDAITAASHIRVSSPTILTKRK